MLVAVKPPYRVPMMAEIAALPWNGLTVASTFSGGGGSCTGYRMAGYRVAYANEFVPAAQATYKANHPDSYLDPRDIRTVTPESVLEHLGIKPGDLDLFDGSPPCSAFSTAGKRQAGWGKTKAYSDDKAQVVDDLFFEYARLLRVIQPKVFVAENVSGLVKGSAKGYFLAILAELKSCGYVVKAKLLDASWLGVPQARQRLIFIGVRNDLEVEPAFPEPLPYSYAVRDALPWLQKVIHDTSGAWGKGEVTDCSSPTITVGVNSVNSNHFKVYGPPEVEADAWMAHHATGREWNKLEPGGQSEKYFQLVRPHPDKPSPMITAAGGNAGLASVAHPTECRKFSIAELKRICAFPDDYVLLGDYKQQWERLGRSVPPVMMASIATTLRDQIFSRLPK